VLCKGVFWTLELMLRHMCAAQVLVLILFNNKLLELNFG
jgi:hypothetical protein